MEQWCEIMVHAAVKINLLFVKSEEFFHIKFGKKYNQEEKI